MNIRTWHQARERKRREARRLARKRLWFRVMRVWGREMAKSFLNYESVTKAIMAESARARAAAYGAVITGLTP